MAKGKGSKREQDDRAAAKAVADKYFTFDRDDEEGDEERRRRHLDEGYELDGPKPRSKKRKAPPPPPKAAPRLTLKQAMFVKEYLVDLNGTQAAIRAGHSEHTAAQIAYENLRKPHIRVLIDHELKERAARAEWNADRVLQRLGDELTADIADLYDDTGALLPVKQWPLIWRTGLVAGIETDETMAADADGELVTGMVRKVKLSDRLKRLELIGKHIDVQAFKERKEVDLPENSQLAALARELSGTSLRPRDPPPDDDGAAG